MAVDDISGRVALVTGGGRGIGRAISLALARAGAAVAVNWVANERAAADTVAAIAAGGGRAEATQADVSDEASVGRMVAAVEAGLGPVDILVNNAGGGPVLTIEETTEAAFVASFEQNLKSAFLATQRVLPGMRERRWGRVIMIGSGAARAGGRVGVHYTAAKAGLEGMARAYALRLAPEGITVNTVAPQAIVTDMLPVGSDPSRVPVGRFGTAEEVAEAVVTVARTGFMTGQTIYINGGTFYT
ncbi:MAG: SDR family NAD(P)-dependent oxidoreductase [Alphaproteobacteria bacterium]